MPDFKKLELVLPEGRVIGALFGDASRLRHTLLLSCVGTTPSMIWLKQELVGGVERFARKERVLGNDGNEPEEEALRLAGVLAISQEAGEKCTFDYVSINSAAPDMVAHALEATGRVVVRSLPAGHVRYVEGRLPPIGHILGTLPDGTRAWAPQVGLRARTEPVSKLSTEQRERIRRFKTTLVEHDPTTLDQALASFAADSDAEHEIKVWERVALLYEKELADRPRALPKERNLLYRAILRCSLTDGTLEGVLSVEPAVKALSKLQRVVERWERGRLDGSR